MFQVAVSGGAPSPLTTLDAGRAELWRRSPQPLPGGRFLLFVQSGKPEYTGVYAASLDKPADRIKLLSLGYRHYSEAQFPSSA